MLNLPLPSHRHMAWYRRGKTAFIHFTVNTFTDREWGDGTESPECFDPSGLDCRQWARVLKDGGFTAAILTAKHHDGFCLWPTAYTEHSVKNSPGKRDVVREFTDACREFGIKPGIYLSPWDRNCPFWGQDAYNDFYNGQLTELLSNYGEICECWWDGAGSSEANYDWKRWVDTVRTLQPNCVIFGCLGAGAYADVRWVGNEEGRAGRNCWATIDPDIIVREICPMLNSGNPEGSHFIPAETNTSIRPGWFYHAGQDSQVKTVEELVEYWFCSAGRNTGILLNLPPDRRGLIHETDGQRVREWEQRLRQIFSRNLAAEGSFTSGAQVLTDPREDRTWGSGLLPEFRVDFPEEITFDCIRVEEAIEHGHRIRGFRVDALTDDGWKRLLEDQCVGFCRACRFQPVSARAVRFAVTDAVAEPVLRFFGLYRGAAPRTRQCGGINTRLQPSAIHRQPNAVEVELGGIYPYNAVEITGMDGQLWQVHSFNGTRYEAVGQSRESLCRFPVCTGSYRLKLTSDTPFPADMEITVSCLE